MFRSICLLGVIALAACSDSSGPDARYACLGAALPTTAPTLVNVTGQIKANALNPQPLSNAIVIASTGTDTLAADTSNTPGFYALSITSGGVPVNGFLKLTEGSHITTYAYPSRPIAGDIVTNVLMITTSELTLVSGAVSVTQQAGKGFMGVIVKDCDGNPLSGATVSVSPAGTSTVKYNSGGAPSASATSTSSDGIAYVFNVTAGDDTVKANSGGHALRKHVVNARADVVTLTEIQP